MIYTSIRVSWCFSIASRGAAERDIAAAANVDTFAGLGDRTGEVQVAMRSVDNGDPNWT